MTGGAVWAAAAGLTDSARDDLRKLEQQRRELKRQAQITNTALRAAEKKRQDRWDCAFVLRRVHVANVVCGVGFQEGRVRLVGGVCLRTEVRTGRKRERGRADGLGVCVFVCAHTFFHTARRDEAGGDMRREK